MSGEVGLRRPVQPQLRAAVPLRVPGALRSTWRWHIWSWAPAETTDDYHSEQACHGFRRVEATPRESGTIDVGNYRILFH